MRRLHAITFVFLVAACGCENRSADALKGGADAADGSDVATSQPTADTVCQREGPPVAGMLKIAVIPMGTTHEYWKAIHAGAVKAELESSDVRIEWKGPLKEDDRTEQINVIENFINAGTSGIAIAPLDNVALARPIREASQAGIGVVVMDSSVQADVCSDYASFVATDNYAGGVKAAKRLAETLGGKGNVIMMRCQEGFASTMQREQGFMDAIAEYPDIRVISDDQRGGATTESAMATAENLLNRFREVDGVYTPNESTTFGMLLALQAAGRAGKVKFVGFDSSEKLIQGLADGHIQGLVLQDPMNIGYMAVKTLVAYLRGDPVPARIDTGSAVATPENMNEPRMAELLRPPIEEYVQ